MNFIAVMVIGDDSTLVTITSSLIEMMCSDNQSTMEIVPTKNFSFRLFYYPQKSKEIFRAMFNVCIKI